MPETKASPAPAAGQTPERATAAGDEPVKWLAYSLGLALQTCLWLLLFLGIAVAVMVGSKLTEFRYVGF